MTKIAAEVNEHQHWMSTHEHLGRPPEAPRQAGGDGEYRGDLRAPGDIAGDHPRNDAASAPDSLATVLVTLTVPAVLWFIGV